MIDKKQKLKELIESYERLGKQYEVAKKEADKTDRIRSELAQDHLETSKAILELLGMDTDNFRGGIYNFTDEILNFLNKAYFFHIVSNSLLSFIVRSCLIQAILDLYSVILSIMPKLSTPLLRCFYFDNNALHFFFSFFVLSLWLLLHM